MRRIRKSLVILTILMVLTSLSLTAVADNYPGLTASVQEIQKYGNLTLDLKPAAFYDAGYELGDLLTVTVGKQKLELPFVSSYSDVKTKDLLLRDDQDSNLAVVAINMGDFAKTYQVKVGDQLTFRLAEKEGYLDQYLLHQLSRSNKRSDYSTDSVYANFRTIATTGIKPGVIYRSSSPINNEFNRAKYADQLAAAVGIKTVVNLADSPAEAADYLTKQGADADYYAALYQQNQVITLNMGVDFSSPEFEAKLARGLKFLAKQPGPYLIHCTEGKDRAGFTSALLEAFMGASVDEIVADYMTSFENYFKVEAGSKQYQAIVKNNIMVTLHSIAGQPAGSDLNSIDLAQAAENYLSRIGLTPTEILILRARLSVDPAIYYKQPAVRAEVEKIEKYGHASTNINIDDFYQLGFAKGDLVTAVFDNGFVLEAPFLDGYYVDKGDPLVRAYPGHQKIAVCINYGKLYQIADLKPGSKLTLMLSQKEGYKTQYEIRKLSRTKNRADYSSDAEFANFRNISLGKIAPNWLYRSSSPINNELGRAAYADQLAQAAGIKTVVNLADSAADITDYRTADDFNSPYYADLYDHDQVITLAMAIDFSSNSFRSNIIKGLRFMLQNDGPYLFHCTEGKDRAGFMAVLLESLMEADRQAITADYMLSYQNYYGVKAGSKKYQVITGDLNAMLKVISDSNDLSQVKLAQAAESYLLAGGMTQTEITQLKTKLSTK